MSNKEVDPAPGTIERRVTRDEAGRLVAVTVRAGCAEAVLARADETPGHIVIPSREAVSTRLAQMRGTLGGPLSLTYEHLQRELRAAGFALREDGALDFLHCLETKGSGSAWCETGGCPWFVEGEGYAEGECPLEHWKSFVP